MFGKKKEKPQPETRQVSINMTKEEVVSYGVNKAMKRSWNAVMIRALIILLIVMITSFFSINWLSMVAGIALCLYLAVWYMRCVRSGKRLWESVKDKPEPITFV